MSSSTPPAQQSLEHANQSIASLKIEQEKRSTNRIIVFGILFGVTGALGLPLLWFSRYFTGLEKITWSVIVVLYTTTLIAGTLGICWWALNQIFPGGLMNQDFFVPAVPD